jgi:hypothetical protein
VVIEWQGFVGGRVSIYDREAFRPRVSDLRRHFLTVNVEI